MKRLIVAMAAMLLFSVCASAQTQFGNDDVNITGVKVANGEFGDNFTACHIQISKPNGKHITLKVVVYGEYHAKFRAIPIDAVVVAVGTHIWKLNVDGKPELLIRANSFDWFRSKEQ